ncbi:unnamed protein product [Porites evermanni]|uniref:Uncharacterized protein n=1 Tax=Porites evermanni TaxID=104178 RepID=A0ABN8T0D2_9CNID|nr:unnamed protein product [Porites evermanni]
MSDDNAATKEDSASRKRRRKRNKGSKSCCEECCESCHNMAESIAEMKAKLDSVLSCIEDIKELKQKQTSLGEKNKQLEAKFVFSQAKNLRDTKFSVTRDFPKEIMDKRKLLVPALKDAKKKGHTATLVLINCI